MTTIEFLFSTNHYLSGILLIYLAVFLCPVTSKSFSLDGGSKLPRKERTKMNIRSIYCSSVIIFWVTLEFRGRTRGIRQLKRTADALWL